MPQKNLECYRSSIKDIDAKRIKELLTRRGLFDPTLSANMIGKAIINLGAAAMSAEEDAVNRGELQFSMSILESVFDFFTDLMNEPHRAKPISN